MAEPTPSDERRALRAHLQAPPSFAIEGDRGTVTVVSAWGLFSAKRLDEGSAMLLGEVRALAPPSRLLDLGCGNGAVGLALAKNWPASTVVLADKDILAVETTQANVERNRLANAQALLSTGFRELPPEPFDLIVSNLPAQAGNEAIDELLLDAYEHLAPSGALVVVTVRGLKRYIKRRLLAIFGDYHKAKEGPRHVVSEAARERESA